MRLHTDSIGAVGKLHYAISTGRGVGRAAGIRRGNSTARTRVITSRAGGSAAACALPQLSPALANTCRERSVDLDSDGPDWFVNVSPASGWLMYESWLVNQYKARKKCNSRTTMRCCPCSVMLSGDINRLWRAEPSKNSRSTFASTPILQ